MSKISQKRTDKLYRNVAEVIMKVRIQCAADKNKKWSWEEVDNILCDLQDTAGMAAIESLEKTKK